MGRTYRPVEITAGNGKAVTVALVDTGADESVISASIAQEIQAALFGRYMAKCASDYIIEGRYSKIKIRDLKEGLETDLVVGVSNTPFDTDDINDEGVDLILGVDFLQETKMELRF